uniref:RING-type domain-containing protein n=1 Tax=Monopterus albus TaxID=43700 RepID=A0A3Q3KJH8_MONAL
MAVATISIEQDQFCCSVCLEILRDPVTIPCGHSYCLDCIEDYWNRPKEGKMCPPSTARSCAPMLLAEVYVDRPEDVQCSPVF